MDFLKQIWGKGEGYAFTPYKKKGSDKLSLPTRTGDVAKVPSGGKVPEETDTWLKKCLEALQKIEADVYFTPALFTENTSRTRENFRECSVVWADFDGNAPDYLTVTPRPSLVVRSSGEKNQHWYWLLTEPETDASKIEAANKLMIERFGSDKAVWDVARILRVPGTVNYKPGKNLPTVEIIHDESLPVPVYSLDYLLADRKSESEDTADLDDLPTPNSVGERMGPGCVKIIAEYIQLKLTIGEDGRAYTEDGQHYDRSEKLFGIARLLIEDGLDDKSVLSILQYFSTAWKWKLGPNRSRYLKQTLTKAKEKKTEAYTFEGLHSSVKPPTAKKNGKSNDRAQKEQGPRPPLKARSMGQWSEAKTQWLWNDHFVAGAVNVVVGDGGSRKSSWTMWLAAQVYKGELPGVFLGQKKKTLFLSVDEHSESRAKRQLTFYGLPDEAVAEVPNVYGKHKSIEDYCVMPYEDGKTVIDILLEQDDYGLLIIDPITEFTGKSDNNSSTNVYDFMYKIREIAARHNVTAVVVMHTQKGGSGDITHIYSGSASFRNAARTMWTFVKGQKDGKSIMSPTKNNLAEANHNYEIVMESKEVLGEWIGVVTDVLPTERTAEDMFSENKQHHKTIEAGETVESKGEQSDQVISRIMNAYHGVIAAATLKDMAAAQKIVGGTYNRATEYLGKFKDKSSWVRYDPEVYDSVEAAKEAYANNTGSFSPFM